MLTLVLASSGFGRFGSVVVLLLLGVSSVGVHYLLHRCARHLLVDLPDEEFLRNLRPLTNLSDELLLVERKYVERTLSIPTGKLDPNQSFEELSRALDFVGSFSVALNDLLSEIEEPHEELSLEPPGEARTAGDLVVRLARVRNFGARPPR